MKSNGLSSEQREGLTPIPQKAFRYSPEQTLKAVKYFKHVEVAPENTQQRLVEADSISLDSSIYLVEAALNYDFDFYPDTPFYTADVETSEYTIPITKANYKVNSDDLEDVYLELSTFISEVINDSTKIKIVDLEAYDVYNNQVTYKAIITKYKGPRMSYNCSPIINGAYADWKGVGNTINSPLAIDVLSYYMNHCDYQISGCPNIFYTNVGNQVYDGQIIAQPSVLYVTVPNYYTFDNTFLSATQIVNYRSSCVSLANSGLSQYTLNHIVASVVFSVEHNWISGFGSAFTQNFWKMTVTYGIPISYGC